MLKYTIAFLLFFLVSTSVNATSGCVNAARTLIYTSFQTGQGYWRNTTSSGPGAGCQFVYTGAVCSIGSAGANNGFLGDTAVVQCPIDDYIPVILVFTGLLGVFFIRKNKVLALPNHC